MADSLAERLALTEEEMRACIGELSGSGCEDIARAQLRKAVDMLERADLLRHHRYCPFPDCKGCALLNTMDIGHPMSVDPQRPEEET